MSTPHTVTLNITVSIEVAQLLSVLDDEGNCENVIDKLIDHAQQGVYRPGAWEREWLCQAFSDDWTSRLESGDPYGRDNCEQIFQRITPAWAGECTKALESKLEKSIGAKLRGLRGAGPKKP